jgi:hypothetical protein
MVGTLLVILANCVVLFIFFVYFRRRIDRALQSESILSDIRAEVDQMIVELNQTTDRNVGLVEDHLERLAIRIAEADRRIVVLKKEAEKVRTADTVYSRLKPVALPRQPEVKKAEQKPEALPEKKITIRDQVLELYRSGMEAREIAAKVDKTLGEVELIITLGTNRA